MCEQIGAESTEPSGLLFGPELQGSDLLVEEAIPIGSQLPLEQGQTIIGFYRALMDADDNPQGYVELVAAQANVSPSRFHCCLLLTPSRPWEIFLRVLMREADGWNEIQQITLDTSVSGREEASTGDHPIWKEDSTAAQPVAAAAPSRRGTIIPALGLLSIAAVAGAYLWISQHATSAHESTAPEAQGSTRTGFSASRAGSAWKLTWNSGVVEAMKPTGAVLSIQDGAGQQDIPLTTADLSSGSIYYSPKSSELAFRLQLQRDGVALVEERVRVLDGNKLAANLSIPAQTGNVRISRPTEDTATTNQIPPLAAADGHSESAQRRMPARTFGSPGVRSIAPQTAPILAEAGPITTLAIPVNGPAQIAPAFTNETAPPPSAAANSGATESPGPQSTPLPTNTPATPVPPQSNYTASRPTKQVQPRRPPGVTPGPAEVQVRVSISAKGKVNKIAFVDSTPSSPLMIEISKAASLWEFEPARLNGQPVPSEMRLIFRFQWARY
jgi:hypothetical protein